MSSFTPQVRMYFTKCELEGLDESDFESPLEEIVIDKALDILENHLLMKDYDIQDEEELEIVQLALLVWERCKGENGHAD